MKESCHEPGAAAHHGGRQRSRPRDRLPAERSPATAHQLQDPPVGDSDRAGPDFCCERSGRPAGQAAAHPHHSGQC